MILLDGGYRKALKHALKITANSTSYGAYAELNEQKQSKPASLEVHSGEDFHSLTNVRAIEAEGSWDFAPLAALITAGSRLLLANGGGVRSRLFSCCARALEALCEALRFCTRANCERFAPRS
jgi:hypothetical protein